jgi:hypothetical protein
MSNNFVIYTVIFKFGLILLMIISMAVCDYKGFIRRKRFN